MTFPPSCAAAYEGEERRNCPFLDDDYIEQLAERAAKKAVEQMTANAYQLVGKSVVNRIFWVIGVLALTGYAWAIAHGWTKP